MKIIKEEFENSVINLFGVTDCPECAGFILSDGRYVNFFDENNNDYYESERILQIYNPDTSVYDAFNDFVLRGNIRLIIDDPGIQLCANIEPTEEQYNHIREYIDCVCPDEFCVLFTDDEGNMEPWIYTDEDVNSDTILGHIKSFYTSRSVPELESDNRLTLAETPLMEGFWDKVKGVAKAVGKGALKTLKAVGKYTVRALDKKGRFKNILRDKTPEDALKDADKQVIDLLQTLDPGLKKLLDQQKQLEKDLKDEKENLKKAGKDADKTTYETNIKNYTEQLEQVKEKIKNYKSESSELIQDILGIQDRTVQTKTITLLKRMIEGRYSKQEYRNMCTAFVNYPKLQQLNDQGKFIDILSKNMRTRQLQLNYIVSCAEDNKNIEDLIDPETKKYAETEERLSELLSNAKNASNKLKDIENIARKVRSNMQARESEGLVKDDGSKVLGIITKEEWDSIKKAFSEDSFDSDTMENSLMDEGLFTLLASNSNLLDIIGLDEKTLKTLQDFYSGGK